MGKIRLYVPQKLRVGQTVVLETAQSHYLFNVMKLKIGDKISCFDNQSGEYDCEISEINKKTTLLQITNCTQKFEASPDVWLLFAPVKKDNTDFIIQKATELGVRKIVPVMTRYTTAERIKKERFEAQAIEAAEQCRRTDIPEIANSLKFEELLAHWDKKRVLYFMDETLNGRPVKEVFSTGSIPCAILVGPEGGFSVTELEQLRALPFAKGVSLGRRILRAETAVAAALSCWQALSGDWQ